ncbi:hypothetical protein AMECASPLE_013578 [Ameca splendens]|uniref:Uncharacterized protein n=1 Tax=Ameca splendens TaxID=208324 RepID=A0ABV0YDB4_9TELE
MPADKDKPLIFIPRLATQGSSLPNHSVKPVCPPTLPFLPLLLSPLSQFSIQTITRTSPHGFPPSLPGVYILPKLVSFTLVTITSLPVYMPPLISTSLSQWLCWPVSTGSVQAQVKDYIHTHCFLNKLFET